MLHEFRDNVANQNMTFLNARSLIRRYADAMIHALLELPAATPGQPDCVQADFPGCRHGAKYVW